MSKITKRFVFIPEAFLQSLQQFDRLEEALALEGTKHRGVLVDVANKYTVNQPKEPAYTLFLVNDTSLEKYCNGSTVSILKYGPEFEIQLHKIVNLSSSLYMVVGLRNGEPYSIALHYNEKIAIRDDVNGQPLYANGRAQSIASANHTAKTSGHKQKPAVATSGVTAASLAQVSQVIPVKKNQYRYLKFSQQGAFLGEAQPDVNDRKTIQALFERAAKHSGLLLDDPTLSVNAFGFIWRRSKVR